MMLHGTENGWQEEFFQLSYDIEKVEEEFKKSGLLEKASYWAKSAIHTMKTGDDLSVPCMQLAKQMCVEERKNVSWPDIPEEYWKKAAEHFGI